MNAKYDLLIKLLHEFIEERNTTIKNAGKIEMLLDDLYKENDDIENYVTYFASYRPEGGEFLYNKNEIIKFCRELLTIIDLKGNNMDGLDVKLSAKNELIDGLLYCFEDDDNEKIKMILEYDNKSFESIGESYFESLINLRIELEKQDTLILCNGSAKNVYPSPMQLSMGNGSTAYKNYLGKQALKKDIVDILDYDENLDIVSVKEQADFHCKWLNSLHQ